MTIEDEVRAIVEQLVADVDGVDDREYQDDTVAALMRLMEPPKHVRWIRITEDLPGEGERVLVWRVNGEDEAYFDAAYVVRGDNYTDFYSGWEEDSILVTHWARIGSPSQELVPMVPPETGVTLAAMIRAIDVASTHMHDVDYVEGLGAALAILRWVQGLQVKGDSVGLRK